MNAPRVAFSKSRVTVVAANKLVEHVVNAPSAIEAIKDFINIVCVVDNLLIGVLKTPQFQDYINSSHIEKRVKRSFEKLGCFYFTEMRVYCSVDLRRLRAYIYRRCRKSRYFPMF